MTSFAAGSPTPSSTCLNSLNLDILMNPGIAQLPSCWGGTRAPVPRPEYHPAPFFGRPNLRRGTHGKVGTQSGALSEESKTPIFDESHTGTLSSLTRPSSKPSSSISGTNSPISASQTSHFTKRPRNQEGAPEGDTGRSGSVLSRMMEFITRGTRNTTRNSISTSTSNVPTPAVPGMSTSSERKMSDEGKRSSIFSSDVTAFAEGESRLTHFPDFGAATAGSLDRQSET